MSKVCSFITIALASVLLAIASILMLSGSAQAEPTLEFSNTPPLKLKLVDKQASDTACDSETGKQTKGEQVHSAPELKTTNATVWVRYADSTAPLKRVRFSAQAKSNSTGDASSPWKDVLVCWERVKGGQNGTTVPYEIFIEVGSPPSSNLPEWDGWANLLERPGNIEVYWRWLWKPSLPYEWSSLSGYLTVTARTSEGDAVPGTLALQLISPAQGYSMWFRYVFTRVAFPYLLITFVLGLVLALLSPAVRKNLRSELDFDIKAGWASNLTTAGAVLGTFLAAGLLPEDPFYMSKSQYTALNAIFALILLLAYLLYRLRQRGFVLLLAGAVILAAAAGELATVCLLLYEISFIGILPSKAVPIIQMVLVVIGLAVTVVGLMKMLEAIKKGKAIPEDKAVVQRFYKAWEEDNETKRTMTFDRILSPDYSCHDLETGRTLDLDTLKERVTRERKILQKRNCEIAFVFENQSSGEGKVSSQIARNVRPKRRTRADGKGRKGTAGANKEVKKVLIDICHIEGGMIYEQWTKPIPSAPSEETP